MTFSDIPRVNRFVEMLMMCDGMGENPYRPPDMEAPPPMTRSDLIVAVRERFGEAGALSLRIALQ